MKTELENLQSIGTELSRLKNQIDRKPGDGKLRNEWNALWPAYRAAERAYAVINPKPSAPCALPWNQ